MATKDDRKRLKQQRKNQRQTGNKFVSKDDAQAASDNTKALMETPGGNVPMGSAEDIAELKALNPTSKGGGNSWPKGDGSDVGTGPPSNVGRPSGNTETAGPRRLVTKAENDKVLSDVGSRVSSGEGGVGNWATDVFATNTRQNRDNEQTVANTNGSAMKVSGTGNNFAAALTPDGSGYRPLDPKYNSAANRKGLTPQFSPGGDGTPYTQDDITSRPQFTSVNKPHRSNAPQIGDTIPANSRGSHPQLEQGYIDTDTDDSTDEGIKNRFGRAAAKFKANKPKRQEKRKKRREDYAKNNPGSTSDFWF